MYVICFPELPLLKLLTNSKKTGHCLGTEGHEFVSGCLLVGLSEGLLKKLKINLREIYGCGFSNSATATSNFSTYQSFFSSHPMQ